jgi:competence protein ComGC
MKQKPNRALSAFTLVEVIAMIVIIAVLTFIFLPEMVFHSPSRKSPRYSCYYNLKEIGYAYSLWSADHGDRMPYQQTVANGGWADFLTNANQGAMCWMNYAIISNELDYNLKALICPCDERQAALDLTNKLANTNVSYFVGVSANSNQPQSILGGDRNLGPGTISSNDYGYSPQSGKGNDVAISTNTSKSPVSWSLKIHSPGIPRGAGNILLGDGSAQQISTATFNTNWLPYAPPTTNWPAGHIPATPSIRLVFP